METIERAFKTLNKMKTTILTNIPNIDYKLDALMEGIQQFYFSFGDEGNIYCWHHYLQTSYVRQTFVFNHK